MNSHWEAVIASVVTALVSVIGSWFGLKKHAQTSRQDAVTELLDKCQALMETVQKKDAVISDLQMKYTQMHQEVTELKAELEILRSTHCPTDSPKILEKIFQDMPHPAWIHEVKKRKWYVNDAFCRDFGVERTNFWTPIDVLAHFPQERAAHYVGVDMKVIESNASWSGEEKGHHRMMEPTSDENPGIPMFVRKTPIRTATDSYIFGRSDSITTDAKIPRP